MRTTTRSFVPSPENPVYTLAQAEVVLAEYVRLQCAPRREAQQPDSGSATFAVEFDTLGVATAADLQQSTRDEMLDGIFGTVAAQLTVPPAPQRHRDRVEMRFRCDGDSATVRVTAAAR
ncbi:MAG: hypothetical protein ABIZ91_08005 [Gemmatimonadaceae bacterium]